MYPKVKIEFATSSGGNARFLFQSATSEVNVSHADRVMRQGNMNFSKKGFQLSLTNNAPISPLNGQYTYFSSDGFNGYLASESGGSNVSISFYVTNAVPTYLYITFDTATSEYARRFRILNNQNSNVVTVNDNNLVTAKVDISSLDIRINAMLILVILEWSDPSKSAKVTNISDNIPVYETTGTSLISFDCSENFMDSELSISPGICEQYANVQIYDRNGFFKECALNGVLGEDAQVTLSAVNNANVEHILGTYLISDWDINSNNSRITINCRDKSYILSRINIPRSNIETRTVDTLLNVMFSYATNMPWEYLDEDTRTRCSAIVIPNCWWLASDLYTMLDKICAVGMLRIYWMIDRFIVGRCT